MLGSPSLSGVVTTPVRQQAQGNARSRPWSSAGVFQRPSSALAGYERELQREREERGEGVYGAQVVGDRITRGVRPHSAMLERERERERQLAIQERQERERERARAAGVEPAPDSVMIERDFTEGEGEGEGEGEVQMDGEFCHPAEEPERGERGERLEYRAIRIDHPASTTQQEGEGEGEGEGLDDYENAARIAYQMSVHEPLYRQSPNNGLEAWLGKMTRRSTKGHIATQAVLNRSASALATHHIPVGREASRQAPFQVEMGVYKDEGSEPSTPTRARDRGLRGVRPASSQGIRPRSALGVSGLVDASTVARGKRRVPGQWIPPTRGVGRQRTKERLLRTQAETVTEHVGADGDREVHLLSLGLTDPAKRQRRKRTTRQSVPLLPKRVQGSAVSGRPRKVKTKKKPTVRRPSTAGTYRVTDRRSVSQSSQGQGLDNDFGLPATRGPPGSRGSVYLDSSSRRRPSSSMGTRDTRGKRGSKGRAGRSGLAASVVRPSSALATLSPSLSLDSSVSLIPQGPGGVLILKGGDKFQERQRAMREERERQMEVKLDARRPRSAMAGSMVRHTGRGTTPIPLVESASDSEWTGDDEAINPVPVSCTVQARQSPQGSPPGDRSRELQPSRNGSERDKESRSGGYLVSSGMMYYHLQKERDRQAALDHERERQRELEVDATRPERQVYSAPVNSPSIPVSLPVDRAGERERERGRQGERQSTLRMVQRDEEEREEERGRVPVEHHRHHLHHSSPHTSAPPSAHASPDPSHGGSPPQASPSEFPTTYTPSDRVQGGSSDALVLTPTVAAPAIEAPAQRVPLSPMQIVAGKNRRLRQREREREMAEEEEEESPKGLKREYSQSLLEMMGREKSGPAVQDRGPVTYDTSSAFYNKHPEASPVYGISRSGSMTELSIISQPSLPHPMPAPIQHSRSNSPSIRPLSRSNSTQSLSDAPSTGARTGGMSRSSSLRTLSLSSLDPGVVTNTSTDMVILDPISVGMDETQGEREAGVMAGSRVKGTMNPITREREREREKEKEKERAMLFPSSPSLTSLHDYTKIAKERARERFLEAEREAEAAAADEVETRIIEQPIGRPSSRDRARDREVARPRARSRPSSAVGSRNGMFPTRVHMARSPSASSSRVFSPAPSALSISLPHHNTRSPSHTVGGRVGMDLPAPTYGRYTADEDMDREREREGMTRSGSHFSGWERERDTDFQMPRVQREREKRRGEALGSMLTVSNVEF
ncbi:hypothetical protein KIPB_004136 [Kipferlia bialata]|uniref:Uncharacterized protein n=1 Tax=Kipferlia bialata TaxID=797122 RepID=A0A9K3CUJ4_9EUKA|nr:hypothetical protein KIPB_004136 [Kipferlia bialata]|eukprot:g4136.t1